MSTVALIDADTLVYESARAAEVPTDWGDGLWTYHAHEDMALGRLHRDVEDIKKRISASRVVMVLSDYSKPNWRLDVDPDYKKDRRKHNRRPLLWRFVREYITEVGFDGAEWTTYQFPSLEGDDVLGILMTSDDLEAGKKVCVSIDKDMKTIPGRHYNYGRDTKLVQTEEDADFFHLLQAVAGDPTDGYGGCPGIGMVRAERFLTEGRVLERHLHEFSRGKRKGEVEERWKAGEPGPLWDVAVSIYESKGLTEDDLLRNARVARILRAPDYNLDTQEVRLWTP